jgi:hypothetical protein
LRDYLLSDTFNCLILKVSPGCKNLKALQPFFRTIHQSFAKGGTAFDFKLCGKITRLKMLGG